MTFLCEHCGRHAPVYTPRGTVLVLISGYELRCRWCGGINVLRIERAMDAAEHTADRAALDDAHRDGLAAQVEQDRERGKRP